MVVNDKLMHHDNRPGLSEFLEQVSKLYELHIYTMGTRHYAEAVAREIDPEDKLFRDRILSRDESGSKYQSCKIWIVNIYLHFDRHDTKENSATLSM